MISIAIGCDHNGLELKNVIIQLPKERETAFEDFGTTSKEPIDYPDMAEKVTGSIVQGKHDRGILICRTGLGMAISANKVRSIRAAICHYIYSAERSRKNNNAQIITIGAQIIGSELAKKLIEAWLASEFQGGHSKRKVKKIMETERRNWQLEGES